MSTFDEAQHPRGQAGNPGQFVGKPDVAPTGELTYPEHSAEATAHAIDARVGGDGALGAFLCGLTRRAPDISDALPALTDPQVASVNRDFEAFASLMATKIRTAQES